MYVFYCIMLIDDIFLRLTTNAHHNKQQIKGHFFTRRAVDPTSICVRTKNLLRTVPYKRNTYMLVRNLKTNL